VSSLESTQLSDGITLNWGEGTIQIEYYGYKKKNIGNNQSHNHTFNTGLPPIEMDTQLMWLELSPDYISQIQRRFSGFQSNSGGDEALGGLHAIEHAIISMAPLQLRMDKDDLGGLSQLQHPERSNHPVSFIYDGVQGGIGFSKAIYENIGEILSHTSDMINTCSCNAIEGCPGCVMEYSCGDNNEPLNTSAALEILNDATPQKSQSPDSNTTRQVANSQKMETTTTTQPQAGDTDD